MLRWCRSLLETLKDDPVEYVRRSVANNLNDISKAHPELVVATAARWWADGSPDRRRLVRHALRTLIKAADADALDVIGFGPGSAAVVSESAIEPAHAVIGGHVVIEVHVHNPGAVEAGALVDLSVHFVKANGSTSPKVFKGGELSLAPGETGSIRKKISLAQLSTRTHHAGEHSVEVLLNGEAHPIGSFTLSA